MTITNKTTFKSETIKGVLRASNFDNNRYKTFKLIYNLFGLLFGMMMVRYLILAAIGSEKSDMIMLWFYIFATIILLYLGMIGMDKNSKKKFESIYKKMIGITFTYEIDSESITMTDPDNDSEEFSWDKVCKWNQDQDYFYLFIGTEECLILDKKGFTQGTAQDLKELVTAIMGLREEESAEKQSTEGKSTEGELTESKSTEGESTEGESTESESTVSETTESESTEESKGADEKGE